MTEVYEDPHERARLRQLAIDACTICDEDGYDGSRVCDHVDRTETHRVGIAKVREVLKGKRNDPRVLHRYGDPRREPGEPPADPEPEPELSGIRTLETDPEPEL
jgi:hypothetical protein